MSKAGKKIIEGLEDAIAFANGDTTRGSIVTPDPQPPYFEECGEGWLALGGSGFMHSVQQKAVRCPVAQANRPKPRDRVDTAHISRLGNTDIYQWYGRKADGCFHPIGKFMRLTEAGKKVIG